MPPAGVTPPCLPGLSGRGKATFSEVVRWCAKMCRLADAPAPAAAYGVDVASTTIAGREMYNTPNYAGPPEDRQPVSEVDVATLLRRWLGLIILVPLVMAGIAVAYSFSQPSVYKASAKVLVGQEQGQRGLPAKPDDLQLIAESAVEVFTLHPVAAEAARRLEEPQIKADAIVENLTAEQSQSGQLIRVTYMDTDPTRAQQIVNTVGAVGAERISTLPISANDTRATVVETATVPTTWEDPDPLRNGLLAAGLGTMFGFSLAFVLESLDHNGRPRRGPSESRSYASQPNAASPGGSRKRA